MGQKPRYCSYCGGTQERFYSLETVAIMLDCSVETVRGWVRCRQIGSTKAGGLRRISAYSLERFLTKLPSIDEMAQEAI